MFRKKSKTVVSVDSVSVPIVYPPGAPLIAGGDKAYAVFNAVSMALVMLRGFEKVQPKKAKQLAPVAQVWHQLYAELRPYADLVEKE